jgi:HEAT repeat protein
MFVHVEALRERLLSAPPPYERRGQVTRALKALGEHGLLPLLALITDEMALKQASPQTREIVLVGAIEAVGVLKDARSAAVMRAILDGPEQNPEIMRAAAVALGQLEDEESLAYLVSHAVPGDGRERAAITGLGYARRPLAARALSARLDARPEPAIAEKVADSMGFMGSSWAWITLGEAHADEGLALRAELSSALITAFPAYKGRAREAIGRALLVIDHPSAPRQLATLTAGTDRTLATDVQALKERWLRLRQATP